MQISTLLLVYMVLFNIAMLALGIRLLSRRALVLRPIKIYPWIVAPLILLLFALAFQTGTLFIASLCITLFLLMQLLAVFALIWRYANGAVVFNCEQKRLIELISQTLTQQGLPFSHERTVFSINQGQSTIQFYGYNRHYLILNIRGDKSFFAPMLKSLQQSLKDDRIIKHSPFAFLVLVYAIFMVGMEANSAFPNIFSIDLHGFGEIFRTIGEISIQGFYTGGMIWSLVCLGLAIRYFIPRPLIWTMSIWRLGGLLFSVWAVLVLFGATLVNYKLNLALVFYVIGVGTVLAFFAKEATIFSAIANLRVGASATNSLREILALQHLEFQETGNEFHLKSGAVIEVSGSPTGQNISISITGRKLEPKLPDVEKLLLNNLKQQPGKAAMKEGLLLLVFGLLQLAYFTSPFWFRLSLTSF